MYIVVNKIEIAFARLRFVYFKYLTFSFLRLVSFPLFPCVCVSTDFSDGDCSEVGAMAMGADGTRNLAYLFKFSVCVCCALSRVVCLLALVFCACLCGRCLPAAVGRRLLFVRRNLLYEPRIGPHRIDST